MTDQLFDHLRATLGDSYRLERELGGGGMGRVFVAEETTLERKVVVKVTVSERWALLGRAVSEGVRYDIPTFHAMPEFVVLADYAPFRELLRPPD